MKSLFKFRLKGKFSSYILYSFNRAAFRLNKSHHVWLMEFELFEACVMLLGHSLRRWLMHRLSTFIKTKWYNQNILTRDKHLDKVSR